MSVYNTKNKFVSYLIFLVAIFILILVTKDTIGSIQENKDLKETYTIDLENKKTKLNELNELKNNLSTSGYDTEKYIVDINEDELISYIYSYIENGNGKSGVSIIKSINITEPEDTELGFRESTVNISLKVPSEARLKKILNFLTSSESKYNFFLSSLSFPYGNTSKSFNVEIPLKILHK